MAWKKNLENTADIPYEFVQESMKAGNFKSSYLSNLFKVEGYPTAGSEEEIVAKWTAASLYTGGADTVCNLKNTGSVFQLTFDRLFAPLKRFSWR
jgi:hypothetical protein